MDASRRPRPSRAAAPLVVSSALALALAACSADDTASAPSVDISGGTGDAASATSSVVTSSGASPPPTGEVPAPSGDPAVDGGDPAAVTAAFGDDFLAMLSSPDDESLRTSPWASVAGLGFMVARAEQAEADGISATGEWEIRVDDVTAEGDVAVASGCIDVTGVTGRRNGEPEPWPGDAITFTATLQATGDGWRVSNFSIPGEACPAR